MRPSIRSRWLCALLLGAAFQQAPADSGRLRSSKPAGPFLVTLFTMPEPLTPGPADFSVMVQDAASGQILSDAAVTLDLDTSDGKALHVEAGHAAATNKLLQAAEFSIPSTGVWHVHLDISQANRHAACETEIVVQPGSRTSLLVWIFALFPVAAIALFVLHQRQKSMQQRTH